MRVTREQDFAFTDEQVKGSIYTTGSTPHQISDFLQKVGVPGLRANLIGRAIGDMIDYTGDGSGHCYMGDIRVNWCAEEDGMTRATVEFTTVE